MDDPNTRNVADPSSASRATESATPDREPAPGRSVVFFDGTCALCHGSVRRLIKRDRARRLCYAPLQGETFAALRETVDLEEDLDSMIYVRHHGTPHAEVFVRSDGILQIARDLGGIWRIASWARFVPRFIRDAVYDFIARHRYRWFGQYDACRLPTAAEREQLLP